MNEVPSNSGADEPESSIKKELQRLSAPERVALEALLLDLSDKAASLQGHENSNDDHENVELREQGVVEKVASGFRDFLGHLDFGPEDPERDPLHRSSLDNARALVPRVKQHIEKLKSCRSDVGKQQIIRDIETEVANGLLGHSGTIDQEQGYDAEKDSLTWRAREHAPQIALIIVGTLGATAVAATYRRHKKRKQD